MLALFFFHLTHYLPNPLYPLYNVHVLNLNDNNIGIGTALYYLTVLLGSTQFRRIAQRHQWIHHLDRKPRCTSGLRLSTSLLLCTVFSSANLQYTPVAPRFLW
jgi:hypothetical protein